MPQGIWNDLNGSLFRRELECSGKKSGQYRSPTPKPAVASEEPQEVVAESDDLATVVSEEESAVPPQD